MEKNNLYIHNSKDLTIKKSDPLSKFLNILVHISAAITFCVLIFLIGYILVNGVPNLSADLFSIHYNSTNVSLLPATFNTLVIIVISLAIAVPIGIFSAIFLVEYAKKGDKTVALIRLMTETLSGIPSIIYGLFGMIFFCNHSSHGLLNTCRFTHLVNNDIASDNQNYTRGTKGSA